MRIRTFVLLAEPLSRYSVWPQPTTGRCSWQMNAALYVCMHWGVLQDIQYLYDCMYACTYLFKSLKVFHSCLMISGVSTCTTCRNSLQAVSWTRHTTHPFVGSTTLRIVSLWTDVVGTIAHTVLIYATYYTFIHAPHWIHDYLISYLFHLCCLFSSFTYFVCLIT